MFPGPERDRLVSLILSGAKTATASLLADYTETGEPLPRIGDRSVLVDSDNRPVAVLATTDVDVLGIGDVTDRQAADEGEGFSNAVEWRRAHETFWDSGDYRRQFADPDFALDDETRVVFEHFGVVERL